MKRFYLVWFSTVLSAFIVSFIIYLATHGDPEWTIPASINLLQCLPGTITGYRDALKGM